MLQVPVRYQHNPKIIGKNRPGRKRYLKGWIRNHNVTQLSWILRHRYQTSAGRLLDQEPWAGGMAACVTEPTNCTCAVSEWTQSMFWPLKKIECWAVSTGSTSTLSTNNGGQPSWSWYQRQVAWIEAKNMSKETQVPSTDFVYNSFSQHGPGWRILSSKNCQFPGSICHSCWKTWYVHGMAMPQLWWTFFLAHYKSLWIWNWWRSQFSAILLRFLPLAESVADIPKTTSFSSPPPFPKWQFLGTRYSFFSNTPIWYSWSPWQPLRHELFPIKSPHPNVLCWLLIGCVTHIGSCIPITAPRFPLSHDISARQAAAPGSSRGRLPGFQARVWRNEGPDFPNDCVWNRDMPPVIA